ncbi:phycobilisome protein [filamentous cyanobacterium LEGE 11480]|uniref:Phycobilisome protein n=1 Tax=Romeriopsis navalis LEGE 11480 TaxID=2777977 RepID=A0A928Z2N7_9CYAN|nr:phycobilisome protein [Romeriopsis navalis]MBE9029734.1 phycobilisome protein [Romeriopsis navalis LEGE 11480]
MALSEAVKQLIIKARIVSFADWQATHPAEAIAIFQTADDERQYLTDDELKTLRQMAPENAALMPIAQLLRDQVTEIVDEARTGVLAKFPGILEPGGGLYPSERANACWRDFWQFLRCITYGLAGQHPHYTSDEGLHYMRLLYQELQVPLDAMVLGLEGIKIASLKRIDPAQHETLVPYFDHLIDRLDEFRQTPKS